MRTSKTTFARPRRIPAYRGAEDYLGSWEAMRGPATSKIEVLRRGPAIHLTRDDDTAANSVTSPRRAPLSDPVFGVRTRHRRIAHRRCCVLFASVCYTRPTECQRPRYSEGRRFSDPNCHAFQLIHPVSQSSAIHKPVRPVRECPELRFMNIGSHVSGTSRASPSSALPGPLG